MRGIALLRVGLTGGIASGKSLVADMLKAFGARLVDTDVVARELVEPGQPALGAIVAEFGDEILDPQGRLDRPRMRERIFSDAQQRERLEAIMHPAIRAQTIALMQAGIDASQAGAPAYVVVVVPLLVETGFAGLVDRVLVVECARQQQLDRLMLRDGITRERAESMLAAQADPQRRRAVADDIIDNSGPIAWTRAQAWRMHLHYMQP